MNRKKLNRIKRAIKNEIAIEVRAIKILAPIFGGAVIGVAGLWAWGVLLIGFLG